MMMMMFHRDKLQAESEQVEFSRSLGCRETSCSLALLLAGRSTFEMSTTDKPHVC